MVCLGTFEIAVQEDSFRQINLNVNEIVASGC